MKNGIMISALLAILTAASSWGGQQQAKPAQQPQPAQPAPSAAPVAKQPAVKSQGEAQALQAIFQAQDPDARIKAAETFLDKYADSDFKALALMIEAETYRQKNDYEKMIVYGERTLEADPNNYMAMLLLAQGIAQRTREFDLDREEKLARVEKYANKAIEILKTAPKPRPDITDDQWNQAKADFVSQAHEALGMGAMARKKYDVAIAEFKTALEGTSNPDPTTMVRLGAVYNMAAKYDDAIAILDKVMSTPNVNPQVRQFAQAERARAIQAKGGGAKPATPPAANSAPQPPKPAAPAPAPPPAEPKKP